MYKLYADKNGWKTESITSTPSEMGGFKEYIMTMSGLNVYRLMQYEAGTHRVRRVPKTEAQEESIRPAITVAVLMEPDEEEAVNIDREILRSIRTEHLGPVVSTLTPLTQPSGSHTYRQELLYTAKKSAASIKTKIRL
jgi:protein subunit release factor A